MNKHLIHLLTLTSKFEEQLTNETLQPTLK